MGTACYTKGMRNYELTLIFSPLLAEQEANDRFQRLVSFVQDQGGILENQRILGKRPLLAPIQKSKEGYLAAISCSVNEEKLPVLEKECAAQEHLLRFMITKQQKRKAKAASSPAPVRAREQEQQQEEKVDLADIDQKLEEIFKESGV